MKRLLFALAFLWTALFGAAASAHEVRPAFLEIDQTGASAFTVVWKQPTLGDVAVHLVPHLSNGWLEAPPSAEAAEDGYLIRRWTVAAPAGAGLRGQTIDIEGLPDTMTDVVVRLRLRGGPPEEAMLRPEAPTYRIGGDAAARTGLFSFLRLGVEHILTGPDHLLFLLALLLIVRDRWTLLKTVSAFTVAHSLTLAAATLGGLRLSTPLLNALIALSILVIAVEALRAQAGRESFTTRKPWIAAFAFGLLHGLGFANGLAATGLEPRAILAALLMFNLGVEIGQLAFIALVLALRRAFRLMEIRWPRPLALAPSYAVGALGAMWTFQYSAILFGAGS